MNKGNVQLLERCSLTSIQENATNTSFDDLASFQQQQEDSLNLSSQNDINENNTTMKEVASSILCLSNTAMLALNCDYKVGLNPHLLPNANNQPSHLSWKLTLSQTRIKNCIPIMQMQLHCHRCILHLKMPPHFPYQKQQQFILISLGHSLCKSPCAKVRPFSFPRLPLLPIQSI